MGSFFLPSVRLLHVFIIFLPCFFNSVSCTNHKASLLPPLTPLLPPILSPLLPPIIPQLLNFTDERLSSVYPIIQSFKNIITSDPLGITITWVGSDICSYTGFYCDTPPDNATATAIASIDFNGFRLSAPSVEGFIDQFPDLALFHANSNNFSGILTPKIANLKHLYELDISNNNFNGPFPTALLTMNTLTFLDIRYNSFTGSIPPQIFRQNLDVLFLNNNKFIKTLPDSIGNTPALYLTLANNKLSGQIPKTIGNASPTLLEALLLNNLLSGCIPYELGFLKDSTFFDAGRNRLTGPLPASLGCMDKMEQLNLADNFLYGRVPEVVCELGSLVNISLSNNYFTGVGVECRKLMEKGVLDLRRNCIEEIEDQRSKEECDAFFSDSKTCKRPETYSLIPCNKVSRRSKRKSAPSLDVSKQRLL